jgi:hypothetical protein
MKIQPELLKLKKISSLQKLILGLILETTPLELQMVGGYDKNCGEIGKELGVSRVIILKEFDELMELGLITSKIGDRTRTTNVTQKFLGLLEE